MDPIATLKTAEQQAKDAALAQIQKQESWIKTNWKPLSIGAVMMGVVWYLVHRFL